MSIQKLIEQLDTNERGVATASLVVIGEAAIEPLCVALIDSSWRIATSAAYILGKIGSSTAVEPLIQSAKYRFEEDEENEAKNLFIIKAAIWALGQIRDVKGILPIINLMGERYVDWDADVLTLISDALRRFGTEAISPLHDFIACRYSDYNQTAALKVVMQMPDETAIIPLIHLMVHCEYIDLDVWGGAESSLLRIGLPAAKAIVNSYFDFRYDMTYVEPDVLPEFSDLHVIDFVFERADMDNSEDSYKTAKLTLGYLLKECPEYGQHIVKRLLMIGLDAPDDSAQNSFAWDTLKYLIFRMSEPLEKIIEHVIEKGDDNNWYEIVSQAIVAVAALPKPEMHPAPPFGIEKPVEAIANCEELIIALLEWQDDLL